MAVLNETEKLICEARNSSDRILHYAYKLTVVHIETDAELESKKDECKYFYYLYTRKHKGLSYNYIAEHILHTSISTLEDRRKKFQKLFNIFIKIVTTHLNKEAAVTKSE